MGKQLNNACRLVTLNKLEDPSKLEIRKYVRCALGKLDYVQSKATPEKKAKPRKKKSAPKKEKKVEKQFNLSYPSKMENKNIH